MSCHGRSLIQWHSLSAPFQYSCLRPSYGEPGSLIPLMKPSFEVILTNVAVNRLTLAIRAKKLWSWRSSASMQSWNIFGWEKLLLMQYSERPFMSSEISLKGLISNFFSPSLFLLSVLSITFPRRFKIRRKILVKISRYIKFCCLSSVRCQKASRAFERFYFGRLSRLWLTVFEKHFIFYNLFW